MILMRKSNGIIESIKGLNIKQMQIYASAQQQHEILMGKYKGENKGEIP